MQLLGECYGFSGFGVGFLLKYYFFFALGGVLKKRLNFYFTFQSIFDLSGYPFYILLLCCPPPHPHEAACSNLHLPLIFFL